MKKIFLVLLTIILCIMNYSPVFAEEEEEQHSYGYRELPQEEPYDYIPLRPQRNYGSLPSSYSSVDEGYLPAVRNQNPYGTCWAHAAMASSEAYGIKNGYESASQMNLSELQLAYYTYHNVNDPLGLMDGDSIECTYEYGYLQCGGNTEFAVKTLAKGIGYVEEETVPYSQASNFAWNNSYAYSQNVYRLKNAKYIPMADSDAVKRAIMEYGAVDVSYYEEETLIYYNSATYAYYNNVNSGQTNHAVTCVGWDDSFSRTNFKEGRQPSTDGAWLIRNSWGSYSRNNGYFWISYEDVSLSQKATAYIIASAVENENIYQYDGGLMDAYYTYTGSVTTANVYTTARSEQLKEVGFFSRSANYSYSISVYAGVTEDQPDSGTLYATAGGDCDYAGYYTVPLTYTTDTKWMEEGTRFSIVLTFTAPSGVGIQPVFDHVYTYPGWFDSQPTTSQHQSFLWTGSKWDDRYTKNETFRIKGMAVPAKLISNIDLGSNLYLAIGDTRTLPLTVTPSGALDTYSLSSSNPLVATVTNNGVVTAVGEGVCEITAIAEGGYTNSITVTVTETPVGVRDFTVSPDSVTMVVGDTQLLTVTPDPLDAQDTFEYQSSDPSVATVSSTGLVSAVGAGNATIAVRSVIGNATRTCSVTVQNIALVDFTVSPQSIVFHPGDTQQLTVTKNPVNASETFAYQSSDPSVATVSDTGLVTAKGEGEAVITVTMRNAGISKTVPVSCYVDSLPEITLEATCLGYNSALLTYDYVDYVDEVRIYQSTTAGKTGTRIYTSTGPSDTCTVKSLTSGKYYYFTVVMKYTNAEGTTMQTKSEQVKVKIKPATVQNVNLTAKTTSITVSWDKVSGASGYQIYRSTVPDGTYSKVATVSSKTFSYTNKSLKAKTKYYYKVRAYRVVSGKNVYGSYSDVVSEYPNPAKVTGLKVTATDYDTLKIKWTAVSYATGYRVYRLENDEWVQIGTTDNSTCYLYDTEREFGKTYYYAVRAYRINEERDYESSLCTKVGGKTSLVKKVTFSLTKDEEHNVTISVDTMGYMDGIQIKYKQGSSGTYCSAKSYAGPFEDDSYFEKAFGLKKGKTYYFTVRCYKYDAKGNKIYSPWSSTKKITA